VVENVAARGFCDLPLLSAGSFAGPIRVKVSLMLRRGAFDQSFGVFFGRADASQTPMYLAAIDGQGTFQFSRRDATWQRLSRLRIHPSIRRGAGAWNRLTIDVRGQTMVGMVNDQRTERSDALAPIAGRIGLFVNAPGMIVVYRDLEVTEL
jgi:hypothetical protein